MSKRQRTPNHKKTSQRQQPLQRSSSPDLQPQTDSLDAILQRAELSPGSLSPAQVIQLQRSVGNQATRQLISQPANLIQRNGRRNRSNNTTQHPYSTITLATDPPHLTKAQFRRKLKLGTFSLEGTSLKAIQDEIKAYEQNWKTLSQNLKDKAWTDFEENFKKGVEMLGQLQTDMQYYKDRHDGEKGHEARVAGMGEAITLVGQERGALPQVGNLTNPTPTLTPVFSRQKGRQTDRDTLITGEKGNIFTDLSDNYFMIEAVKPVLEVFGVNTLDMNKSREALELRRKLKVAVKGQITGEITGGSADQLEDAKRFVDELAKSVQKDILDEVTKTEAGRIVGEVITAKKAAIETTIAEAMRSAPLTEAKGKTKLRGYVAGKGKLTEISTKAVADAKAGLKDIGKVGGTSDIITNLMSGVTTGTGAKALGTKEITERKNLEATLENFAGQAAPVVIENKVKKPLKLELAFRLGESRRYLRKSNTSKPFREALKGAARDKAAEKIYTEVDTQSTQLGTQGKTISDTRKEFAALQAQSLVYDEVKKYVDEVSLAKAAEIVDASLPGDLEAQLKKSAKTELYSHTRFVNPTSLAAEQQLAWATTGASAKAKELYPGIENVAVTQTNTLIGDVGSTEVGNLKTKVSDEVGAKQDVTEAVKQVIEAENLSTGLAIIGGLIDTQVANIGSSVKLDIQLKIPVFNQGVTGYITIQFLGEASRDQGHLKQKRQPGQTGPMAKLAYDKLKAKAELTFGFGIQLAKVFDINAQFGLVVEAQADNSTKMMQLFSYGAYRRFRDNGWDKAADAIWGMGGKTRKRGGGKYTAKQEAEIWAALVEEEAFNLNPKQLNKITDPTLKAKMKKKYRDAYVRVGLIGKGKAVSNVGIGKLEVEAKYSHSTEYSKRSIGDGLGKTAKTTSELEKANKGRKVHYFELSGKLETLGESLSGEAKLKITVLGGDPTAPPGTDARKSKLLSAELELEVQVIAAFGKDYHKSMEIMAKYIAPLAAAITKFVDTARNAIRSDDPAKRSGSSIAGAAGDLAFPLSEIENGNEIAKGVIESAGKDWEDKVMGTKNPLFEHKAALALAVKLGVARDKPEKPLAFLWEVALLEVKGTKIDSGVFKAEFETKQRLGRVGSEGVGGLGFGKM